MKFSRNAQIATLLAGVGLLAGTALSTRLSPPPSAPTPAQPTPITTVTITATTAPSPRSAAVTQGIVTKDGWQVVAEPRTIEQIAPAKAAANAPVTIAKAPNRVPQSEAEAFGDTTDAPQSDADSPVLADDSSAGFVQIQAPKGNTTGTRVVCIDPGHPSETSAGANFHGLSENRLNWQVALELKAALESKGIKCVLTKGSEKKRVTNRERATIANNANAELFIRLHCDEGAGRGWRWYYPDRSGKKYGVSGPPKNVQIASGRAAKILNESMKSSDYLRGYLKSNPVTTDASTFVGGKQGGVLTGSIFARVPTALIEMCFINQKSDAQFIASEAGRKRMAYSLTQAIIVYLNQTPDWGKK